MIILALSVGCTAAPAETQPGPADTVVRDAVVAALEAESAVDASRLDVVVQEGVVQVAGTVSSTAELRRVLRTISAVDGVRGLVNRIRVVAGAPDATGPWRTAR